MRLSGKAKPELNVGPWLVEKRKDRTENTGEFTIAFYQPSLGGWIDGSGNPIGYVCDWCLIVDPNS